ISEALRHYQRLEKRCENHKKTHPSHHLHKEYKLRPSTEKSPFGKLKPLYFDPIQLRRKQCSSTLIEEENRGESSSSSGFRSISRSSIQTLSLVGNVDLPIVSSSLFKNNNNLQILFSNDEYSKPIYAEALWNHITLEPNYLPFNVGDLILVLNKNDQKLWYGRVGTNEGWFQAAFVRVKVCQEDSTIDERQPRDDIKYCKHRPIVVNKLNFMRSNVIQEIVKTENDYLNHLKNICNGYIGKMRQRSDLFSTRQIEVLMGNIEQIYSFHQHFFQLLKLSINEHCIHESLIGKYFLLYKEEFKQYSDYCINHPLSCIELNKLETLPSYKQFFE
ncbi:unnamed protein product, partial [Didymodactylos carnosus]